ncbi:MAG: lytic murein transglycosylase B [bacterium]|nr:lytic murein transglycosylase B [Gammaproteobacteria bacterium]
MLVSRVLFVWFLFSLVPTVAAENGNYGSRQDVDQFVEEMVAEGFDKKALQTLFSQAQFKQSIIDAISRPAERTLTWNEYQDIFLTRSRVEKGLGFMNENRDALVAAQDRYGVPAVVITAIIGVETFYGRITGKYRVIDSLTTLAFDYPPRSSFFREELKHFLRLVKEEGQDANDPLGSYAGAMGYGQFISSSYRHYAVDFDSDGLRDIWNNPSDAIGSVANYLARHGWRTGELITVRASKPEDGTKELFNVSLKPTSTMAEMSQFGVLSAVSIAAQTSISPMLLNGKQGEEVWLGLQNFYVITRYNHSKLYAMAVYQLSEKLKGL